MPPVQAQALLEYLRQNPEEAKKFHSQAQQILKNPSLASAFLNMQNAAQAPMQSPEMAEKFAALKDDEDLKPVFEDVLANGPQAFAKYWDDTELMGKISAKMRAMGLSPPGPQGAAAGAEPKAPAGPPTTLHAAAKAGDVEALNKLVEEGKDVDEPNERGVSPLGIAVGFNRIEVIKALLAKGAKVDATDSQGNTAMHYACGYGRKDAAEVLAGVDADLEPKNKAGQTPRDVAGMNKEKAMVEWVKEAVRARKEAARS